MKKYGQFDRVLKQLTPRLLLSQTHSILPHGDCLSFYAEDVDSYAERVDNLLTVFRSMRTEKLIGFEIKGVQHIVKTLGNLS